MLINKYKQIFFWVKLFKTLSKPFILSHFPRLQLESSKLLKDFFFYWKELTKKFKSLGLWQQILEKDPNGLLWPIHFLKEPNYSDSKFA